MNPNLVESHHLHEVCVVSLVYMERQELLNKIKQTVLQVEPEARVILYGSYARGEEKEDSDIDLLILVDKDILNYEDGKRITYPLFSLGYDEGVLISPIVYSKKNWETKYVITPFYENVTREGLFL
ncbi:MAG: nucleotidyltransferase domain-containing protein [Niabella sp.]